MSVGRLKTGSIVLLDLIKKQEALLFTDPASIITCNSLDDVAPCLRQLEQAQDEGLHAAGFLSYELGFAFEPKLRRRFEGSTTPLLWFGLYDSFARLSLEEAKEILSENAGDDPSGLNRPEFDMNPAVYDHAFEQVQRHLAMGDIYQVNLTLRAQLEHYGTPENLFLELMRRQPVEFAAYLKLEDRTILSLSPEMFLERRGSTLRTRPMKGTAPRGRYASEDSLIALDLSKDPKQRSENTMIVDLLRNDLSCVAEPGSVQVTHLCDVERYQSLHQMTSTVEATVPETVGFAEIIRRLFPCGSITGAPKLSAMQIAHDLETGPRGIYTGSIGYLEPGGDFRFNVAIRTLDLKKDGTGVAGTGSGVVFDSGASPEYDECVLKLKFMTEETPEFKLIETMAFEPGHGYLLLERHLRRLQLSAAYFDFGFDETAIRATLETLMESFHSSKRVRLLLNAIGDTSVSATELTPTDKDTVFSVVLADEKTNSADPFLYHKTTNRSFYDDTRVKYQQETGCHEVLFENENGFLTEGSYTSLFVRKAGKLLTPAQKHGLLPGTFRAGILEAGLAVETDLTRRDLEAAEAVYVANSVRGLVKARVLTAICESLVEDAAADLLPRTGKTAKA